MTLAPELVSEWIDAFPITAHVSDQLDGMYCCDDKPGKSERKFHKEELKHRRALDAHDRDLICAKMAPSGRCASPSIQSCHLPNCTC